MKLIFKLKDKQNINIINEEDGRIIGRIFTPSGTSQDVPDAIQVCGFSDCFNLWSCGKFSTKNGNPAKDIQLLFEEGTKPYNLLKDFNLSTGCGRCFFPEDKCMCWDLRLIMKEDIPKAKKEREIFLTKHRILEELEDKK